jgi:uncharacterized spore protein YtfJ
MIKNNEIDLVYIESNPILKKTLDFSVEIIEFCKILRYKNKEYNLANQLIRSVTSTCPVK